MGAGQVQGSDFTDRALCIGAHPTLPPSPDPTPPPSLSAKAYLGGLCWETPHQRSLFQMCVGVGSLPSVYSVLSSFTCPAWPKTGAGPELGIG